MKMHTNGSRAHRVEINLALAAIASRYVGGSLTHREEVSVTYKVRSLAFLFALPHFSAPYVCM
jgi:hypothetical protein